MLEWRLHPVAALPATGEHRHLRGLLGYGAGPVDRVPRHPAPLDELWDGLEAFAAYGDDLEPQPLAIAAGRALGIEPDACGLVDHEAIAAEWERTGGGGLDRRPTSCASSGSAPARPGRHSWIRALIPSRRRLARIGLEPVVQVHLAQHPAEPGQTVDDLDAPRSPDGPGPAPGRGPVGSSCERTRSRPGSDTARITSKLRRVALTTRVSRSCGGEPRRSGGRVPRTGTSAAPKAAGSRSTTRWAR